MRYVDRAVVLAAGVGSRLKWLTHHRPKALVEIAGEPAIVHVIRRLAGQGARDIAINVHYHADMLVEMLGDGSRYGVRLYYSREKDLLDSGGGVRKAMELLPEGELLAVYNTDVLADIDLQALSARVPETGAAIALVPNPPHHPHGDFSLGQEGVTMPAESDTYTFSGVSVWHDEALRPYPVGEKFPLTESMRALIDAGRLGGMVHRGRWFDIGRPRDLMQARRLFWQSGMMAGFALMMFVDVALA